MDRVEADLTPAEEWQQSLNATCNRLSTQYLNLLRAASSVSALGKGRQDPRGTFIYFFNATGPNFRASIGLHTTAVDFCDSISLRRFVKQKCPQTQSIEWICLGKAC